MFVHTPYCSYFRLIYSQVAMKYFNYYVKLSKMLEELVDDIEVLDKYTRDNAKSPEIHEVRHKIR